jgi:hypothetical protein
MMMPEKEDGTIGAKAGGESMGLLSDLRGTQGGGAGEMTSPKKALPPEATMMLGLVAASALLLYGLRMYGMRGGLAMADMQIEYTRDQTISAGSQERVMAELARQTGPAQIPAERIHINPFMLAEAKTDAPVIEKESDAVLAARRMLEEQKAAREARKLEIEKDLAGMALQGVMQGRVPLARVNGVVVRVGDKIGEHCIVKEIKGRSVVIEADKALYELHMPDGSEGKPGKH